jgi:8-hydroxy-5-deazaflavin:NADPH oxidoreductase
MKIGIIGAGKIGGTLGQKWAAAGHTVCFGVRDPQGAKHDALRAAGSVLPVSQATGPVEAVLLSLPGAAVLDFVDEQAANLADKLIIDATNNLRNQAMHALELLNERAPSARLVRAFSTLGWENFVQPALGGVQIDLFFCSQSAARPEAQQLISDIGLRPVYIGGLDAAPLLDNLTRLYFALATGQGLGRRIALKLLQDP